MPADGMSAAAEKTGFRQPQWAAYSGHYRGWIETYWTPMKEIFATGTISQRTEDRVKIDREQRIKTGRFRRSISTQA